MFQWGRRGQKVVYRDSSHRRGGEELIPRKLAVAQITGGNSRFDHRIGWIGQINQLVVEVIS